VTDRHEKFVGSAQQDSLGRIIVESTVTIPAKIRTTGIAKLPSGPTFGSKMHEYRGNDPQALSHSATISGTEQVRSTAIRSAAAKSGALSGTVRQKMLERAEQARPLFAKGLSNLEIAARLGIRPNLVPDLKRACGIEVNGFRKGSSTRKRGR